MLYHEQRVMKCKADFRRKLDASGIHHAAIFADLDGLSRRLIAVQGYRASLGSSGTPPPVAPNNAAIVRERSRQQQKGAQVEDRLVTRIDPLDPQKGLWGGHSSRNGWTLSAEVREIDEDWYGVVITVEAGPSVTEPTGSVTFHLHDTYVDPVRKQELKDGKADLRLSA